MLSSYYYKKIYKGIIDNTVLTVSSMVKRFKTASGRVEEQKYYDYVAALSKKGSNPNDDILKRVDEVLKEHESRERAPQELPREPGQETQSSAGTETPKQRTITINGKTYTY